MGTRKGVRLFSRVLLILPVIISIAFFLISDIDSPRRDPRRATEPARARGVAALAQRCGRGGRSACGHVPPLGVTLELRLGVRAQRNDFEALALCVIDGTLHQRLADAAPAQRVGHLRVIDDDQLRRSSRINSLTA